MCADSPRVSTKGHQLVNRTDRPNAAARTLVLARSGDAFVPCARPLARYLCVNYITRVPCPSRYFERLDWAFLSSWRGTDALRRGSTHSKSRVLTVLGFLLGAGFAVALPTAAYATQESEALIKEGIELRRAGQDAAAIPKLQRAFDIEGTPRSAAQLGLCLHAVGRWSEADHYLALALAAPRDPWVKKNRDALKESSEAVKMHVGRVDVLGDPEGAQVFVNGKQVGTFPLPDAIPVNEGLVKVEVRAIGFEPSSKDITISARSYQRLVMRLVAQGPKPLPSVSHTAAEDSRVALAAPAAESTPTPLLKRPWFWIGAGTLVGAAVLTTIVLGSGGKTSPYFDREGDLQ